jgi:DNA-binding SARP family transcriptional activator
VDHDDYRVALRLLGPVEVTVDESPIRFRRPQQRDLVALLALNVNRPILAQNIIDAMWADRPPRTAHTQLQNMISAVRSTLSDADSGLTITTGRFGYQLNATVVTCDVQLFGDLVEDARGAGDAHVRMRLLRQALALWRGEPLSDVRAPFAESARVGLLERRTAAEEVLYESAISAGQHLQVLAELSQAVLAQPTRENFLTQLMEALYRSGRRIEALETYRQAVRRLSQEYGLEPSPQLRALELRLLRDEMPADDLPALTTTVAQLPPDIPDFTGRDAEANRLRAALSAPAGLTTGLPRICVLSGRAGSGKTTLAVHVAHKVAASFPDGQIYVDLAGMQPDPVPPATALNGFLRALGVAENAIPADVGERSALFRSRVAERRLLFVLDNAAGEAQIRPLFPGASTCAVLVTARQRLVALGGAEHVDLGVFTERESVAMLRHVLGDHRIDRDPAGAASIADQCGHLPLALRIAAARLGAHPHWSLRRFGSALADRTRVLDELAAGDLEVRASIGLSYAALSADECRAIARLACLDVPHVASWVLAALVEISLRDADTLIERLVEAQLVQVASINAAEPFRYTLHDLVRAFGRERAAVEDAGATEKALARAFGCWLALAEVADSRLPSPTLGRGAGPAARWQPVDEADRDQLDRLVASPIRWFEEERNAIVSIVAQASAMGMPSVAWQTASTLTGFFELHGHLDDWRSTHLAALEAVRPAGDVAGQARMLRGLGRLELERDELPSALTHLNEALRLFETADDIEGRGHTLLSLGYAERLAGDLDQAVVHSRAAADRLAAVGERRGAGYAWQQLGVTYRELGDFDAARSAFRLALDLATQTGDRRFLAYTHRSLGLLHQATRDPAARDEFADALAMFKDLGDEYGQALALQDLGDTDPDQARGRATIEQALAYGRKSGNRFVEARALLRLGIRDTEEGALQRASEKLDAAMRVWDELGMPLWQGRTIESLAEVAQARGDTATGRRLLERAWAVYQRIGAAEGHSVARRLAELVRQGS